MQGSGKVGNWGRWGENDERGALNFITPEVLKAAVSLVRKGKLYSLAIPLGSKLGGVPFLPYNNRAGAVHMMALDGGDFAAGTKMAGGVRSADDYLFMFLHGSTHVDALCHVWYEDQIYGGFSGNTVRSTGARYCDIAKAKGIVGRGVLLDIAKYKGVDILDSGYVITRADLAGCAEKQGVSLRTGDILLVRTGWINAYPRNPQGWTAKCPGIGADTVPWIVEKEICAVGADNPAVEVLPPEDAGTPSPVHLELLRNRGLYIMEMLNLDEIAADKAYEFLFMAAPLRITGGTGSPLNPLAIV